ncbi:hypothetical protein EON80_02870 [bacterium]|nr:MAG: hypothetical protein EON80_02870 [bacterium]
MKKSYFGSLSLALALLGASPHLTSSAWAQNGAPAKPKVDPDAAAKAKLEIVNEGELRLDGKITALLGTGAWQIEAASWTSPRGVTTDFDEPKNKGVKIGAEAYLHPRGQLGKVPAKDVKLGARVGVIGKNGPDGMIIAREIVLLEGYGDRTTAGSVTTNRFTSQMVSQSREAREAGLLPKALALAEKGIATAQGMGDSNGEALATQDKALLLLEMDQPEQAFTAFKRVEALGRAKGNTLMMALGMGGAGRLLISFGKTKEAITLLKEADVVSAALEPEMRQSVMRSLFAAYMEDGNTTEAIGTLNRIHPLQTARGKEAEAGITLLTIALMQADEKPDAARMAIDEAKGRIERLRDDKSKVTLIALSALIHWRLDEKDDAREGFTKASDLAKNLGDNEMTVKWGSITTRLEGMEDSWESYWGIITGDKAEDGEEEAPDEAKKEAPKDAPPADEEAE